MVKGNGKKTVGSGAHAETAVALERTLPADPSEIVANAATHAPDDGGASSGGRLSSDLGHLRRGAVLDKFIVLGELGSGSMGLVLAAYDPELDRKVAIKVLRADRGEAGSRPAASARLLREAQALAKLSHPNVITIFEVTSESDRVALVMEYVDGSTLKRWLANDDHRWRDVLNAFVQAGRGLAAAHAKGLVHRDFKPDNVLVGKQGRVRVTDFGLVSTAAALVGEQRETDATQRPASAAERSETLTSEGSLVGTVAYMAPEQLDRIPADARADQFSYCVALYEALYGRRPFSGATYGELCHAIRAGKIEKPPDDSHVPRWLYELVVRGLRADPAERHASMDALLDALARDPRQRRTRLALGAGAVGLAAVAVFGLTRAGGSEPRPVCAGAGELPGGVWDAEVRARVRTSFTGTKRSYAGETLALVETELDRRAKTWVAARVEVCEATHARGEQSERLLDLRMHCLDRRLGELRSLTALFGGKPDAKLVDGAIKALSRMTPLTVCDDTEALLAETPLPEDPRVRTRVQQMRTRLDQVGALERAGRYQRGIKLATAVAVDVKAVGYPPIRAEALHLLASLLGRAGNPKKAEKALYAALQAAADARDHGLVADAWIELIMLVGTRQGQHARALALRRAAQAAVAQAGNQDLRRARLASSIGLVLAAKGDHAAARNYHERALAIQVRVLGAKHSRVAMSLGNLANSLAERGKYAAAREHYERALAIQKQTLGAGHPELGFMFNNLGNVVSYQGENATAVKYFERGLKIWEKALTKNHPLLASLLNNLGSAQADLGQMDDARKSYQRALDMMIATFGSKHPAVAAITGNLGELAVKVGDYAKAMTLCRGALAIYEKTVGPKNADNAYALTCIGQAHLGSKAPRVALTPLRRALALREANPGDPPDLAKTRFALARALWATGVDRVRAVALAKKSRAAYTAAGAHKRRERDVVIAALARWSGK